jgi:hypothetical protein
MSSQSSEEEVTGCKMGNCYARPVERAEGEQHARGGTGKVGLVVIESDE